MSELPIPGADGDSDDTADQVPPPEQADTQTVESSDESPWTPVPDHWTPAPNDESPWTPVPNDWTPVPNDESPWTPVPNAAVMVTSAPPGQAPVLPDLASTGSAELLAAKTAAEDRLANGTSPDPAADALLDAAADQELAYRAYREAGARLREHALMSYPEEADDRLILDAYKDAQRERRKELAAGLKGTAMSLTGVISEHFTSRGLQIDRVVVRPHGYGRYDLVAELVIPREMLFPAKPLDLSPPTRVVELKAGSIYISAHTDQWEMPTVRYAAGEVPRPVDNMPGLPNEGLGPIDWVLELSSLRSHLVKDLGKIIIDKIVADALESAVHRVAEEVAEDIREQVQGDR